MKNKPKAPIIGANGNIFNLMAITSIVLKENGLRKHSKEMYERVTLSKSYEEALSVIVEYVEPVTIEEYKMKGN